MSDYFRYCEREADYARLERDIERRHRFNTGDDEMRGRLKEWSNRSRPGAGYVTWTVRIIWFEEEGDGENIRLQLEDCERRVNYYPRSQVEADHVWQMFKSGAPEVGVRTPFVAELLVLLASKYPAAREANRE